jgi:hypothetical protein
MCKYVCMHKFQINTIHIHTHMDTHAYITQVDSLSESKQQLARSNVDLTATASNLESHLEIKESDLVCMYIYVCMLLGISQLQRATCKIKESDLVCMCYWLYTCMCMYLNVTASNQQSICMYLYMYIHVYIYIYTKL